jgi:hypothetical protein
MTKDHVGIGAAFPNDPTAILYLALASKTGLLVQVWPNVEVGRQALYSARKAALDSELGKLTFETTDSAEGNLIIMRRELRKNTP